MQRPYPNDPRLTGIAIAFKNREMIADQVMPRVGVGKTTFKWNEYDFAEGVTIPETQIGRKGRPTEVEFTATEQTGGTKDYGLDDVVPNDDVADVPAGSGIDPLGQATEGLTNLIVLAREIRVAAVAQNAANYNHADTLTGTDQFDDPASDPAKLISDAIETPLVRPNIAITSLAVYNVLRRHPKIVSALNVSGSTNGQVSKQALIEYLELDDLLIGSGWVNTAKPGQAPVYARVWGNDFILQRRAPIVTAKGEPSWGFTAQFGDRVAKRIDEPKIGLRGAVRVRVGESVGEIIQSMEAGYILKDAI
jgi:hypothetical protein